jgi:hypothetical protein
LLEAFDDETHVALAAGPRPSHLAVGAATADTALLSMTR